MLCLAAEEKTEKKFEMANVDSELRSVHTTRRTRILFGIGIAIVGGIHTLPAGCPCTPHRVSIADRLSYLPSAGLSKAKPF